MVHVSANTIVVGVDGSDCSDAALQWAIDEARRSERRLLLVHVWHWASDAIGSWTAFVGPPDSLAAGRLLLHTAATNAREQGVRTRTSLVHGSPSNILVTVAENAAMLVVGSHGHRLLGSMLVGSVSRSCLSHASCPVVVVPPTWNDHRDSEEAKRQPRPCDAAVFASST